MMVGALDGRAAAENGASAAFADLEGDDAYSEPRGENNADWDAAQDEDSTSVAIDTDGEDAALSALATVSEEVPQRIIVPGLEDMPGPDELTAPSPEDLPSPPDPGQAPVPAPGELPGPPGPGDVPPPPGPP
jgi:hypothetical protein